MTVKIFGRLAQRVPGWLAALAFAAALTGCAAVSTTALNSMEPDGGVVATRDIVFQDGRRGALDVYRPPDADGHSPVVVFYYGGSWTFGARWQYAFLGKALARRGVVVVIPDYRLYPEVRWPSFLEDCARAAAWAKAHAADYGGDPKQMFLMGHSAGAYNALMLAEDPRWLRGAGMDPSDLRGVIGLAGPYEFPQRRPRGLRPIFEPGAADRIEPIDYADGRGPPLLLATDDHDDKVSPTATLHMADKVRAAGGEVEVREYPGLSHVLLVGALAAPLRHQAPVLQDILDFVRSHAALTARAPTVAGQATPATPATP